MIDRLYSEYDTDITIRPAEGKTFNEGRINYEELKNLDGVQQFCRAVEEVVILKHEKKWVSASMIGVDPEFLQMIHIGEHMVDGHPMLSAGQDRYALIGASLLDKLGGYIPSTVGHESLVCYVPKRKLKISLGKNPFKTEVIKVSGRINYNREVNEQSFIVPLDLSQKLLEYENQISAIYISCKPDADRDDVKLLIQEKLGSDFVVKTNHEKNELVYKTSKSEKLIVLIILLFIFVLAAFNLVASLTMLFVEKLDNQKTMISFGAHRNLLFRIFFFEGLLIAGKGIVFGALLGYVICFVQIYFSLVTMPNSAGEPFPINVTLSDGALILGLVSILSVLFSYFPVKYLIRKNIS